MFELTKRRADTLNLVFEGRVAFSASLPSPDCWKFVGGPVGSWRNAALAHLDEYRDAAMLAPTAWRIRSDRANDFALVEVTDKGREQWNKWREEAAAH